MSRGIHSAHAALRVDIHWSSEVMAGAALAVVDVLRAINALSAMRSPRTEPPASWRWCVSSGDSVPRSLPRSVGFRGLADLLVLPGWHAQSGPHLDQLVLQATAVGERALRVHRRGGMVAGLYNAAALLGAIGLLKGRSAVVPWPFIASVLRHEVAVDLLTDRAWTADQRVWTCDSVVLASEVVLDMLHQTPLAELAAAAAHVILHSSDRQKVAGHIGEGEHQRLLPAGALERARRWLEDHLTEPYSLAATAQAAATSPRTLLRHFSSVYGQSPLDYLHSLRVVRARVLLETTYVSVDQVARMCGYQDAGTFRRIFSRLTHELPATYRERYRLRTSRQRWSGPGKPATGAASPDPLPT